MKKILLSASAVTLLIGAASCSQEEVVNPALNGDGNVNITLSLPGGMGTRAFADGLTANDLEMAVYDAETNNLVYRRLRYLSTTPLPQPFLSISPTVVHTRSHSSPTRKGAPIPSVLKINKSLSIIWQ